jgi:uncharacterized repeat protein (TIGR03837 family)
VCSSHAIIDADNRSMTAVPRWDIFCRVIDNHGDLGVCWRLTSQLVARAIACRLWVDDDRALAWMAPSELRTGDGNVQIGAFDDAARVEPGDVVVEAFGCDPPAAFVARMHRPVAPVWINLEYLSAQAYVERSHGLASPQLAGAGAGLTKWFFYPGFTASTGGLLRAPRAAPAPALPRQPGERAVFVFAYDHARLEALLHALDGEPTLVVAAQGPSLGPLRAHVARHGHHRDLRLHELPWLDQPSFDAVLDACDLNIVRGEDSLVQALWAGQPFVWNIYAQHDGAHVAKLHALLDRMLDGADPAIAADIRRTWLAVNSLEPPGLAPPLPRLDRTRLAAWRAAITPWLARLRAQEDLVTRLLAFVARQQHGSPAATSPG